MISGDEIKNVKIFVKMIIKISLNWEIVQAAVALEILNHVQHVYETPMDGLPSGLEHEKDKSQLKLNILWREGVKRWNCFWSAAGLAEVEYGD